VFSTAIQFLEGFFVKQYSVSMFVENFLEDLHGDQVVIDGFACLFVDGSEFELIDGNFVVLCFEGNTDLQEFMFYLSKDVFDFDSYFSIVMI